MHNDARDALPIRWLYKLTDKIIEHGKQPVQQGILTGIIQDLDPELYRDVLRSIIRTVYASGDAGAAGRLSMVIVRGNDYINGEIMRTREIDDLHEEVSFQKVELQKRGCDVQGLTLIKR